MTTPFPTAQAAASARIKSIALQVALCGAGGVAKGRCQNSSAESSPVTAPGRPKPAQDLRDDAHTGAEVRGCVRWTHKKVVSFMPWRSQRSPSQIHRFIPFNAYINSNLWI
jgi:hypothetical protein